MPDYNPRDVVTLAELKQLLGAAKVRKLYLEVRQIRRNAEVEAKLRRMREIVEALPRINATSGDAHERQRWIWLQDEFTQLQARLDELHTETCELVSAPAAALPFALRTAQRAPDRCVACGLTEGGVCPDHAALGDNC